MDRTPIAAMFLELRPGMVLLSSSGSWEASGRSGPVEDFADIRVYYLTEGREMCVIRDGKRDIHHILEREQLCAFPCRRAEIESLWSRPAYGARQETHAAGKSVS